MDFLKYASVKTVEDSTVTGATQSTLSQSAYLQLREKLLQSAPAKKAKISFSPEVRKAKAREAMAKKRIPSIGGNAIARRIYGPPKGSNGNRS